MRSTFTAPLCAAVVGLLALSQGALAQQKTVKQCNDEWVASQAAIEAGGKSRRDFIAECRGLPVGTRAAAAAPLGKGQFATEAEAKASCPSDAVVWVNLRSRVMHAGGSNSYGKTKRGAYMCEKESTAAGFRAPRSPSKGAKPAEA